MENEYKPRAELLLVERISEDQTTSTGIIVPNADSFILVKFKVLKVGPKVTDLKPGDIVLAEDAFQPLSKIHANIGLLNEKYIHLIKEQYGRKS